MSLKRALLMTSAAIAVTVTIRSASDVAAPILPAYSAPLATLPGAGTDQETPATPAGGPMPPPASVTQDGVDVSALRYFAAQHKADRVAAELRLLRKAHPNFQPPEDLYTAEHGGDEQALWDLYAKHDIAGIRTRMDEMRRDDPAWRPSSDLARKVALAEGRDALLKASDDKRWADVVQIASANRALLTCGDLDAIWRTAEALAQTGDEARAFAAYRYVLANCDEGTSRVATVQKASLTLRSSESFDKLVTMGRHQPDGRGEFDDVRLDQVRQKIGAAAAGTASLEPSAAEIGELAAFAKTAAGNADAMLLGWFYYARADYPAAQGWFRTALATNRDAKAAEGLVLALRSANDNEGARAAAMDYAALDVPNRKLMLDVLSTSAIDPQAKPLTSDEMTALTAAVNEFKSQDGAQALSIYATRRKDTAGSKAWSRQFLAWKGEEIEGMRSAEGAEALGWLLYQGNDIAAAETWFKKSADWAPSEAAAVGLVVTSHRLHHDRDYSKWVAQYRGTYPEVAKLATAMQSRSAAVRVARVVKHLARVARARAAVPRTRIAAGGDWDQSATDIVTTAQAGKDDQALAMLNARQKKKPDPRGLSVVRGWVLYRTGHWEEAKQIFANLDHGKYSPERMEGLRVIELGYTNPHFR